jgi:mono/diheme cytochrome c family protein
MSALCQLDVNACGDGMKRAWRNAMKNYVKTGLAALAVMAVAGATSSAAQETKLDYPPKSKAQDYINGEPAVPSDIWMQAAGGRIYDKWWDALGRPEPTKMNPAYPTAINKKVIGSDTWRCKECHAWDYQGSSGIYSKGGHFTGIKGILGAASKPKEELLVIFRDKNHPYTKDMITDAEMERLAAFINRGLVDMRTFLDFKERKVKSGDIVRGREIFQTTCAACHGFDGRALDWGTDGGHNYVGTEAVEVPDEVYNKISNAHTGVQMINLRAFSFEDRVSLMAYAATLPLEQPPE